MEHDDAQVGEPVDAPSAPAKRTRQPKAKAPAGPDLVIQHNLSADNLHHAHKMGGLAAPSIAVVNKDHGMNSFGEISLLAHHSLIDPKHTPVFDADVYSPRAPRAKYRVNEKALKQFKTWLKPAADHLSDGRRTPLYNVSDQVNERGHMGALDDHDTKHVLQLAWLNENGVQIPKMAREKNLDFPWVRMPAMKEFLAANGTDHNAEFGGDYHRALSEAAKKSIEQYGQHLASTHKDLSPEDAKDVADTQKYVLDEDDGLLHFGKLWRLMGEAGDTATTQPDVHAMHDAIREKVKELGEGKFNEWAKRKLSPLEGEPYLPKGQRKMRYDLDAVLKEVTRSVRQGENFNYGLGTARAGGAKKFRDISGIQKDRHKIVSHEEFDAKKKAMDDRFGQLADKLAPYHSTNGGFGMMDALSYAIGDSYKRGRWLGQTLKENAFEGVPPHLQQELANFAGELRQMPTEYFEAKPQRVVGLNEFKAAVVPHNTSQDTLDILRHHGIHHVETYERKGTDEDAAARRAAVERAARAHELLLSEPDLVFEDLAKAEDEPGVALVTAYNDQGELLLGRRRDNEKWTLPGGHLNPGEDPRDGAERELYEETGLRPTSLSFLKEYVTASGVKLHCFSAYVTGKPHSELDPDDEVSEWKWVDVSDGLPSRYYNNLQGPKPDSGENLVANIFDLGKAEEPLEKGRIFQHVNGQRPDPRVNFVDPDDMSRPDPRDFSSVQGHVYRGISHAEHDYIVKTGHVKTNGRLNIDPNEGTCYAPDYGTAESYTNFGSTNPARLGAPNYVLELKHHASIQVDQRDGYPKSQQAVPATHITRVWRYRNRQTPEEGTWGPQGFVPKVLKFELAKAEDEVGRLLDHPDPTERRLALRLNSTKSQHVIHAALDPDPIVHETAIDHPLFDDVEALHLMDAREGHDGHYPAKQQLAFLARSGRVKPFHLAAVVRNAYSFSPEAKQQILPAVIRHPALSPANVRMLYRGYGTSHEDRMALLEHVAAPVDVLEHAIQTSAIFPGPQAEELAIKAASHANLTPAAREALVRQVGDTSPPHLVDIARRALASGPVPRTLIDDLFMQRALKPASNAYALVGAALRSPVATPEDIDRALTAPHPAIWVDALGAPQLQPRHMDQLVSQAHAAGDRDALKRMMDHPHFGRRHLQVLLTPTSALVKAEPPHDPGEPRSMDPIEAEAWVSRMRFAHKVAPWTHGTPRWGTLHTSLVEGHPEAFAYVKEKLDPAAKVDREEKQARALREERQRRRYEGQAVEIGDHTHKPDHQVRKLAAGKHVWLYHGTSSKLLPQILKEGLRPQEGEGKIAIHPHETPGVYLTGKTGDGPATASAYAQRAASYFGGDPVVLRVKHPFDDLQPDGDDADLSVGRHQFKTDYVPPHHIMEVNGERVRNELSKAESNLHRESLEPMASHPLTRAMLGFDPSFKSCFRAARFLAGGADVPILAMRRALYAENGNLEAAALRAYGFEVTQENLKALRSVQQMGDFEKGEANIPNAQEIVAPHPEGKDVADSIRRAYERQFVFRVKLGGKHSSGSMIAHDEENDTTWLLKTGANGAGVAAGADQDPSDPNAREAAWYHIAEAWGVADSYPRAELVMIDGQSYAALKMLPWSYKTLEERREKEPNIVRRILHPYLDNGKLHQWAVLDFVLGNPDSHGENVMSDDPQTGLERRIHTQENFQTVPKEEDVKLIDHGSAFAGPAFDPAHDKASFVPYVLRAWAPHDVNFNQLPEEEKLRYMPRVDAGTAKRLKTWLQSQSAQGLQIVCERYGINPQTTLDRLARLRLLTETIPIDEAVNRLWSTT
jgi:ADP-ribose pyrophosphatase YjhB (NUDIX family)